MKVTDQSCLIQSSHPELICSSTFWEHPYAEEIQMKVLRALPYFPEITFPLTLNRHGTRGSSWAIAYVNFKSEPGVNFNIGFRPSMNTVFHELGHILQHFTDFDIPYGEEAASIYTLSRMPDSFIDSENILILDLRLGVGLGIIADKHWNIKRRIEITSNGYAHNYWLIMKPVFGQNMIHLLVGLTLTNLKNSMPN